MEPSASRDHEAPGLIAMPIVVDAANNYWGGGPPATAADVAVTGNVTFSAGTQACSPHATARG